MAKVAEQEIVTILTVEGEKPYSDAIKSSTNALKTLDSEMKLVDSTFGENNKSLEALTAKNKILTKQFDEQAAKVSKLGQLVAITGTAYGEMDYRTLKWQKELNEAQVALNNYSTALVRNKQELQALNVSGVDITPTMESSNFNAEVEKTKASLQSLQSELIELKTSMKTTKSSLDEAVTSFGKNSKEALELEKKIENLQGEEQILGNKIQVVVGNLTKQNAIMMAESQSANQGAQALDKHAHSLDKESVSAQKAANATGNLRNKLDSITTVVKGIVLGMAGKSLYDALIGDNAKYESALSSFEILMNSATKADVLMKSITDLAVATPLDSSTIEKSAQMLLGFGVAGEEVIDTIKRLGDLSRGNAEMLDRISLAYGQMVSKGKVTGEELRQMVEAQVPLLQALSDYLGKSTAEVSEMISKGEVSVDDLNGTIKKMTSEGGQFFGMMDKQAQTFTGSINSLKGELSEIGRGIGTEAFDQLKSTINDVLFELEKLRASGDLETFTKNTGEAIADFVKFMSDFVKVIYEGKEAITVLISALAALKIGMAIEKTILAVVESYKAFKTVLDSVVNAVKAEVLATKAATVASVENTAAIVTQESVTVGATVATSAFSLALKAIPFVAIMTGALLAVGAIVKFSNEADTAANRARDAAKAADELSKSLDKTFERADLVAEKIKNKFDDLKNAISEIPVIIDITDSEELAKLEGIAFQLSEAFNIDVKVNYDTGELNVSKQYLEEVAAIKQLEEEQKNFNEELKKAKEELPKLNKSLEDYIKNKNDAFSGRTRRPEQAMAQELEFQQKSKELAKAQEDGLKKVDEITAKLGNTTKELNEHRRTLNNTSAKTIEETETLASMQEKITAATKSATEAQSKINSEMQNGISDMKSIGEAYKEQAENGKLSAETTADLIIKFPQLASAIIQVSDGYVIEKKALDEVREASIATRQAQIQAEIDSANQVIRSTQAKLEAFARESQGLSDLMKLYSASSKLSIHNRRDLEQNATPQDLAIAREAASMQKSIDDAQKNIANLTASKDALGKLMNSVGTGGGSSNTKKSSSGSTKKELTQEEILQKQTDAFVKEYNRQEKLTQAHIEKMDRYNLWSNPKEKIEYLENAANDYKKLLDDISNHRIAFESREREEEVQQDLTSKYYELKDEVVQVYTGMYDQLDKLSDKYIQGQNRKDVWSNGDSSAEAWGRIAKRYENALKELNDMQFDSVQQRLQLEEDFNQRWLNALDEQKEAFRQEYDERRQISDQWIQDRNFYEDWGTDDEISAWKRVKKYTEEYYEQGKISHKEYASRIRELDKNIYSEAQKEAKEAVQEVKEREKAKYEAVKDRIDKENAERKRQYDNEDRLKRISELQTLEGFYRTGVTQESQKKYADIVDEMNKLKREMDEDTISQRQNAELEAAEANYTKFESSIDSLTKSLVDAYISQNKALIESLTKPQEEVKKLDGDLSDTASSINDSYNNISKNMVDTANTLANTLGQSTKELTANTSQMFSSTTEQLIRFQNAIRSVQQAVVELNQKGQSLSATITKQQTNTTNYNYQHNGNYVMNSVGEATNTLGTVAKKAFNGFKFS